MVITSKLAFTQLQSKIFRLLCKYAGQTLNQSEIARKLRATPPGVAKALKQLQAQELIELNSSTSMNLNKVKLANNRKTKYFKQVENFQQIYETKLIEILEGAYPGCTIVLFGSYSRGEDTIDSDIDIAIIGSKLVSIDFKKFENILIRSININHYKNLHEIDKELRENICNGLVLVGGIEL